MFYKYITSNNLDDPQDYMYAPYGGKDFLKSYAQTRERILSVCEDMETEKLSVERWRFSHAGGNTFQELIGLWEKIYIYHNIDPQIKTLLNRYVKRFEVRKRFYNQYRQDSKTPFLESGYHETANYLLFGLILKRACEITGSLKYLSCFLKLNDTLLSLENKLDHVDLSVLKILIKSEFQLIREQLVKRKLQLNGKGGAICDS